MRVRARAPAPGGERLTCFVYVWTLSRWKEVKLWAQVGPSSPAAGGPGSFRESRGKRSWSPGLSWVCLHAVTCFCVHHCAQLREQLPDPEEAGGTQDRGQELDNSHRDRVAGDRAGTPGCLCHEHPPWIPIQAWPRTRLMSLGPPDSALPAPAPFLLARARGSGLLCPNGAPSVSPVPSPSKDSPAGRRRRDPAHGGVGQAAILKGHPELELDTSRPGARSLVTTMPRAGPGGRGQTGI